MVIKEGRSQILDQLRGISALLVVIYHFCIFFFTEQNFSAALCHVPPIDFSTLSFVPLLKQTSFDLGSFAVALFFLLSGFFMPALLERYVTPRAFLLNRLWRLGPTFAAALAINLVFLISLAFYHKGEMPYTVGHLLSVLTLTRDVFGYPLLDGVIWTLEIEWKFCFFIVFCAPWIRRLDFKPLLFWQNLVFVIFLALYTFLKNNDIDDFPFLMSFSRSVATNLRFFSFLLIGSIFYLFQHQKIDKKQANKLIFLLTGLFFAQCFLMFNEKTFWKYLTSYLPALGVFSSMYHRHSAFSTGLVSRSLTFLTHISYPLYLIHAMSGYGIIYFLYDQGVPLAWGIGCALLFSVLCALFLHRFVETPTHKKAKRFAQTGSCPPVPRS